MPAPALVAAIPLITAGVGAAGSIWSAMSGAKASDRASRRQLQGAREGIASQEKLYGQTKEQFQPYITAGQQGLAELSRRTLSGEFNKPFTAEMMSADPGLQYRMQQANLALERSASARGRLLSGGTIRNVAELNQSLASQEYGAAWERNRQTNADEFNRLNTLSTTGLGAAQALGGFSQTQGQNLSDLYTGMGNVQGANAMNQGQIQQGLIGGITNQLTSGLTQWGQAQTTQSAQPKQYQQPSPSTWNNGYGPI